MVSPAPIPQPIILSRTGFTETVASERDWLVRWFVLRCGGQSTLAEDLAQETLLSAWRIRERYTVGERGARPWLAAIARNVLLRWQRASGNDRSDPLEPEVADSQPLPADDSLDPVWFSEQDELRDALDRALATLPSAARDLLIRRYLREESIAEIALTEEQSVAHVGVRLQRARNAVRKAIDDLFPDDFADDLAAISPTITTPSRLWCPRCGTGRLQKTIWRDGSSYHLICPVCCADTSGTVFYGWYRPPEGTYANIPAVATTFRRTMSARELLGTSFGQLWPRMQHGPQVTCPHCDAPTFTRPTPWIPSTEPNRNVQWWCPRCGDLHQNGDLTSVALNHPRGDAFWREEDHIRTEPLRETTIDNQPGFLVTFRSVQRTASITFGYTADATRLLLIDD